MSLLGELMKVGFSLQQAVAFTTRVLPACRRQLLVVEQRLKSGHSFSAAVRPFVGVDLQVQLLLAERHGNLAQTLDEIGSFLTAQQRQRQKLMALLQYPLLLLLMLAGLLVALKIFVFPEIKSWQSTTGSSCWQWVPWQLIVCLLITTTGVVAICEFHRWQKADANGRAARLCRLPAVGKMFRLYYSYYLISNLAVMLNHGLSLNECCQVTKQLDQRSLLSWWGKRISQIGSNGGNILTEVQHCRYLPRELSLFFERGLPVTQLAGELSAYHELLFQQLLSTTERLLVFVQPLLFILVAVLIVGMYLSILLPIYHSLQGVY